MFVNVEMEHNSVNFERSFSEERSGNSKFGLDSRNLKFFKDDILNLPFEKLSDTENYKHLRHVFVDEDDYEDFKLDLMNFHQMRSKWKDDRKKVSKERPHLHSSDGCNSDKLCFYREDHQTNQCEEGEIIYKKNTSGDIGKSGSKQTWPFLENILDSVSILDFFHIDESFQEFDRVFETVKNKRRYASNSSLDKYRSSPSQTLQPVTSSDDASEGDDVFLEVKVKTEDIFSDFFDNDADFQSFEEEFETFQSKRQSLERWHRNSVCDLIEDLKAFCDSDVTENECSKQASLHVENCQSLPKLWSHSGEWDYIFNKIRSGRNISSSVSSESHKSDLTVTCDGEFGNNLQGNLNKSHCRGTGYCNSESSCSGTVNFSEPAHGTPCSCQSYSNFDCQYTCHHKCLPLIQLECKTSHDATESNIKELTGEQPLADLSISNQPELNSEPETEKDETDSGYRSGTIPDEKLPNKASDALLNFEELKKRIAEFNKYMPGANFALREEGTEENKISFQGFIKVTLNLVRPISMSLGARPPSIYEVLTREHIVEQNTLNISFYMPRDTIRSIHAHSSQTAKEVIALLLKKFHILDNPRKFVFYEQELQNNKIAKLRRVKDNEFPLSICLSWDLKNIYNHRLVLQENETGEIDWDAFCIPELNNFLRVLDKEEDEYLAQLKYKYKLMKRVISKRMTELRLEQERSKRSSVTPEATS